MARYNKGFTSLCGDVPHEGHFLFLKWCRQQCDYLTVALTVDSLMAKEKRVPVMPFRQRRSIFENCRYVDFVVANNGDPKAVVWEKLRFDVLFTVEEYYGSSEFNIFQRDCPTIPVFFMPREPDLSSTGVIKNVMQRFCESQKILTTSINGQIVKFGFDPYYVVKPINFAHRECVNSQTGDPFGFYSKFSELPRNWKSEHHHTPETRPPYPLISGLNSNREIIINFMMREKPWCTYVSTATVYEDTVRRVQPPEEKFDNLLTFANYVAFSRQYPQKIVSLVQRDAGITFELWCETICKSKEEFKSKVDYVEQVIIADLEAIGVVHGDCHSRNLLIDKKGNVSLIDFGWVTGRCFDLCEKESAALETMLENNFDRVHFRKSMRICKATKRWLDELITLPDKEVRVLTNSSS